VVGHSRQTGVGELALQTLVRIKYAGLNSDQLDLIPGKNLVRLLCIDAKPSALKTMDVMQI
jgi:hypothetical protein